MKGIRTSDLFILPSKYFIKTFLIIHIISFSLINAYSVAASTVVNGRILITYIGNTMVTVLLQINTNSGLEAIGGTTMILGFDTSSIGFSENPINNVDYFYHNFCGENYSLATVTHPMENRLWINIDLPYQNCNEGTIVSGSGDWTDVVSINFNVLDQNGLINIYWLCSSPFWGIYDDDNTSFWTTRATGCGPRSPPRPVPARGTSP